MSASEMLGALRKKAQAMESEVAVVGWFNTMRNLPSRYAPLSRLRCVMLTRDRAEKVYKRMKLRTRPAMLTAVPAIWEDGCAHIGGEGWWMVDDESGRQRYTHDPTGALPAGVLRDVFGCDYHVPTTMLFDTPAVASFNHRLIKLGLTLLDAEAVSSQKGYVSWNADYVEIPKLFSGISRSQYLALRDGPELEEFVTDCANRKAWSIMAPAYIGELRAGARGEVVGLKNNKVHFCGDEFKDTFDARVAAEGVERRIKEVFGVHAGVPLFPVVGVAEKLLVREWQALFTPLPKKESPWTTPELKGLTHYGALKYFAALTTTRPVDGVCLLDNAVAYGKAEPVVDFDSVCRIQKLRNREVDTGDACRTHTLQLFEPGVRFDLVNLTVKTYVHDDRQRWLIAREARKKGEKPDN
jgi:hypothetical protein